MSRERSVSHNSFAAAIATIVCALAANAFGQITVTSPTNNSTVGYPVQLTASFAGCGGSSSGFGYSIGNSPFITWGASNSSISNTDYRLTPGSYVIHFKGWTGSTLCETNVNVTVTGPSTTTAPNIELNSSYKYVSDSGTGGTAAGTTQLVTGSPCQDSQCRQLSITSYTNDGGMRWSSSFGLDTGDQVTHFVYDTYIYFTNATDIQNIEMDTNQVWDSNDDVLIYGTQCATVSSSGKWEYTTNDSGTDTWNQSSYSCPIPSGWTPNTWHHVQIAVHRDGSGNAYYDSVLLDGKMYDLANSGFSSFALTPKWTAGDLLLNFQIDGKGSSGSVPAFYVDGLTEIYW
jgi:hypothetical protein